MLHGNISQNGYGDAIIGRYGGYFEEDRCFMCRRTRGSPPTGFGCTGEGSTMSRCESRKCVIPKRLENMDRWKCINISNSTLVIKNSNTYCECLAVYSENSCNRRTPRRVVSRTEVRCTPSVRPTWLIYLQSPSNIDPGVTLKVPNLYSLMKKGMIPQTLITSFP